MSLALHVPTFAALLTFAVVAQTRIASAQTLPSRSNWNAAFVEVNESDPRGVEVAARTHAALTAHREVLVRAISAKDSRARQTRWFKELNTPAAAIAWLHEHLRVEPVAGTGLIRVSIDAPLPPGDARVILDTVVSSYIDLAQQAAEDRLSDRKLRLTKLRIKYETRARELMDRMFERMLMLDLVGVGTDRQYTLFEAEVTALLRKRAELLAGSGAISPPASSQPSATQPSDALGVFNTSDPALAAIDKRLEELKHKLGDYVIATSDLQRIRSELDSVEGELRKIRFELDTLESTGESAPVRWAFRPSVAIEGD
jgi:hypothetical protein